MNILYFYHYPKQKGIHNQLTSLPMSVSAFG